MPTEKPPRNRTSPISAAIACDRLRALRSERHLRRQKLEVQLKDFDVAELAKEQAIRVRVPEAERGVLERMLKAFEEDAATGKAAAE